MQFQIQKRYLNLPVKNGAPMRRASLLVDGQLCHEFDIELAGDAPDIWAFLEISSWMGKTATLQVSPPAEDSHAFELIEQSDAIRGGETLYQEALRPQFHFTARCGWNNDPNGLLFNEGEYHLFFQHNPYGIKWGNMHWGHAASPDLIHWQEMPEALSPDELGTMFSGSGVVDWGNTAGFASGDGQPLVLIYTAAGGTSPRSDGQPFSQCIAWSCDRGRTWTKWPGNPALPQVAPGNRDPKVIWHAASQRWVMALYLDGNDFALFASPDLKAWTRSAGLTIPGSIECPDFFELPVDGNPQDTRWVFWASDSSYLIGRFDGQAFTQESLVRRSNHGGNSYAAQTWSDIPASDGRRIQMSWLQVDVPGMPFNQGMTFPVSLSLRSTRAGLRLFFQPVREIETLYTRKHTFGPQELRPGENPLQGVKGETFDLNAELSPGQAAEVGFGLRGVPLSYDVSQGLLICQGSSLPLEPVDGKIRLRLLVDRTSIEIFANDGLVYLPLGVVLDPQNRALEAFARRGEARIEKLEVFELVSIWNNDLNTDFTDEHGF